MSDTLTLNAYAARTADGTEQANTLSPPVKFLVKGKLFYKRKWNYNTSKNTEKFREYLPSAKIELHVQEWGADKLAIFGSATALTEKGEFLFKDVPPSKKLSIKVILDNKDGITTIKGRENLVAKDDYELKTGKVIWRLVPLDEKKLKDAKTDEVDFGDVEILPTADVDADFAGLCDMYKTIWRGHNFIRDKAGHTLGGCPINYPERTISYESGKQLYILPGDIKDCDVLLHEYGHFIGEEMLGGLNHPGYSFDDDAAGQHGPNTEEHYESAWNEGHATFLSCAISDDPTYRDGYDSDLTMKLDSDNITLGPHCEGSIQCALWDVLKVQGVDFKKGFWTAFKSSKRKGDTIFNFFENWKDEGCPDIDKLKASLKKFNCHIGYTYTKKLKHGTKALDPAKPAEFKTLDELYDAYGKTAGGTLADYSREFYNRNRYVGGGAFKEGNKAKKGKFTLVAGTTYIVPERFEIK